MKKAMIICLAMALALSVGCRHHKKEVQLDPGERGSDKRMFDDANGRINRDPERARLLFKEVMQLYPDSIYAGKSKLGIADSYFREKDSASLIMAAAEYQEYVNLYPYSPDAVYAKHQIGMCYFKQMRKPERDQTSTYSAIKAFEALLQQYPGTPEAEDAKKKLTLCRQNLATHFFRIGYYNYVYGAWQGAVNRFKQVIDEYPEFAAMDKLLYYCGRAYYDLRDYESAISFFQRVSGTFPKSKYASKARGWLKKTNAQLELKKKTPAGGTK